MSRILTPEEKAWVEKNMPSVGDTVEDEVYKKIVEGMKKESNTSLIVSESGYNTEQQNDKNQETPTSGTSPLAQNNNRENTAVALYDVDWALGFFRHYAKEKGLTFNRDMDDSTKVSGDFTDSNGEECGRVSVKDNKATSDIKGIEALVKYAKERGYESITLGSCSDEYAEEMAKVCEALGMKLIGKDGENLEQKREQNVDNGTPGEISVSSANQDETKNNDELSKQPQLALPPAPEDVSKKDKLPPETQEVIPLGGEIEVKEQPKPEQQNTNDADNRYVPDMSITEQRLKGYKVNDEFIEETKKMRENLANQSEENKPKEEFRVLLREYAIAAKGEDKNKDAIAKALQYYNIDSITFSPNGDVSITQKTFSERTDEEKNEIKSCHDKLLNKETKDKQEEKQKSPKEQNNEELQELRAESFKMAPKVAKSLLSMYLRSAAENMDDFITDTKKNEEILRKNNNGEVEVSPSQILMRKYAIGVVKEDAEMTSKALKALQLYGFDNIQYNIKTKREYNDELELVESKEYECVDISTKLYSDRTIEEKREIHKANKDLLLTKTGSNKKGNQKQSVRGNKQER